MGRTGRSPISRHFRRASSGKVIPRRVLDAYAGEFALAPQITVTITVVDSGLYLVRPSRPVERLTRSANGSWYVTVCGASGSSSAIAAALSSGE